MKTIRKSTAGYKEENLKDVYMLKTQALELVPTYNADEDGYVLDLSIYHNHDILVRGGWNTLGKYTEFNLGYCQDFNGVGKGVIMSPMTYSMTNDDGYSVLGSGRANYSVKPTFGVEDYDNLLIQCRRNSCELISFSEV